jgi:hypothetical protein
MREMPELIRPHLPAQRVGDVPEPGVEGLFCVVGHEERHESDGGWGRPGQTEPAAKSAYGRAAFWPLSWVRGATRCFFDLILVSNEPTDARLRHLIFQMNQTTLI